MLFPLPRIPEKRIPMNEISFDVSQETFTRNVLLRTCHCFGRLYYTELDQDGNGNWRVSLKAKNGDAIENPDAAQGEFRNRLVNESLRDELMTKAKTVKEIIVARALFGAAGPPIADFPGFEDEDDFGFIEDEMDDYLDDPLGIAVPWEEKHKQVSSQDDTEKDG